MWINNKRWIKNDVIYQEGVCDLNHVTLGFLYSRWRIVTSVNSVFHSCHKLCNMLIRYDRRSILFLSENRCLVALSTFSPPSYLHLCSQNTFAFAVSAPISIRHAIPRDVININMTDWMDFVYITSADFWKVWLWTLLLQLLWVEVNTRSRK